MSKDTFINRVRNVLGADPIPGVANQSTEPSVDVPPVNPPAPPTETTTAAALPTPSPPISSTPPLSAKAKGKQKAVPAAPSPNGSSNKAQQAARDALRKKKQEEKDELARIQARIEQDKIARKAEADRRRIEREREQQSSPAQEPPFPATRIVNNRGSQAKQVNLSVRLFDGRTVRSTFPRTATLQDKVRPWIEEQIEANTEDPSQRRPPYFFKQIQAPLPSRELTTGEENEPLGDIGLAPSATLVLIPVKGYTEAYSGGGNGPIGSVVGGVTSLVGGAFGVAYNAVGYVGSTLGSIVGIGSQSTEGQAPGQNQTPSGRTLDDNNSHDAPGSSTAAGSIRVRTLADQRERDDERGREFYNGNQVSTCIFLQGPTRSILTSI